MTFSDLPTLNAGLNLLSAVLLFTGWVHIRRGNRTLHARFMIAAFLSSVVFLASYLVYHAAEGSTPYQGVGSVRTVYFAILISHVILAAVVPPLALRVLWLAWKQRWETHRAWARWTFPIWMYVSVTGVVVYVMLYVLEP